LKIPNKRIKIRNILIITMIKGEVKNIKKLFKNKINKNILF